MEPSAGPAALSTAIDRDAVAGQLIGDRRSDDSGADDYHIGACSHAGVTV